MLVDEQALSVLQRMARPQELAELLRVGMSGYEEACAQVEQGGATAETIVKQAHRVKGSAGTLGLCAISGLAVRLEESALQGHVEPELIAQLRAAVVATRAELERRGLLPGPHAG